MSNFTSNLPLLRQCLPDSSNAVQLYGIMETKVSNLDEYIVQAQEGPQGFQAQAMSASLAVNSAFTPPVQRLPPEILGYVFEFSIVPPQPVARPSLVLLHVCRRWRNVAQGTPQLWTDIRVCCDEDLPYAEMCLGYSGALPLRVDISLCCTHSSHGTVTSTSHSTSLSPINAHKIAEILSKKSRFEVLRYTGTPSDFVLLFPPESFTELPLLEEIVVDIQVEASTTQLLGCLEAPRLRTIELCGDVINLATFIQPTGHLQRLKLELGNVFSVAALFNFLRLCPGIEDLIVSCDSKLDYEIIPEDVIHLPALRKFDLQCEDDIGFINVLRAPNLYSAALTLYSQNSEAISRFSDVCINLRNIELYQFDGDESAAPLLQALPALKKLETFTIIGCQDSELLWTALTPDKKHPLASSMCPALYHLTLCFVDLDSTFVDFIEGRGWVNDDESYFWVDLTNCNLRQGVREALKQLQCQQYGLVITGLKPCETDSEFE